jgi:hypothetical protein
MGAHIESGFSLIHPKIPLEAVRQLLSPPLVRGDKGEGYLKLPDRLDGGIFKTYFFIHGGSWISPVAMLLG